MNSPTSAPNQPLSGLNRHSGACFVPYRARNGGDFRFFTVTARKVSEKHRRNILVKGRKDKKREVGWG